MSAFVTHQPLVPFETTSLLMILEGSVPPDVRIDNNVSIGHIEYRLIPLSFSF